MDIVTTCEEDFCNIQIDIEQVEELYTKMSELVYNDMDRQYKERKINGSTYASTWAELMKAVVAGSMSTIAQLQMKETAADRCIKYAQCDEIAKKSAREECLSDAECALKDAQKKKVQYETEHILPAQASFTIRQTCGFDDNKAQKMLEIQMNAWSMMFSSGLMGEPENGGVPEIINNDEVTSLYNTMKVTSCDITP